MAVEGYSQNCLAADVCGSGPPLLLLHGLFASGGNLRALAKALSQDFTVHSVDLPLHGQSKTVVADSIETMGDCLAHYVSVNQLRMPVIVGHSLGGKVAMSAVLSGLECQALVVLDIAPVTYAPSHQAVFAAVEQVATGALSTRHGVRQTLNAELADATTIEFLLTQLRRDLDGVFHWKFDWQALKDIYPAILAAPVAVEASDCLALFVAGSCSNYINAEGKKRIKCVFPRSRVITLKGAGHWPHVEKFDELISILRYFLNALGEG